jgi:hypothetical protein
MTVLDSVRKSLFWISAPIFFINFVLPVKSKALGANAMEIGGLFSLFTLSLLLFRRYCQVNWQSATITG